VDNYDLITAVSATLSSTMEQVGETNALFRIGACAALSYLINKARSVDIL
jgi:hypothetical protein